MLRVVLTIALPLMLPTALYVLWVSVLRPQEAGGAVHWASLPWVWLAVAGAALVALVLITVTVRFGAPETGVYVPPREVEGHIVGGHIEPAPAR